jgi:ribosomal protein L22
MSSGSGNFSEKERISAENFRKALEKTSVKQVVFLTGIINEEKLSKHLQSRKNVEQALKSKKYALTCLRAGIIVGSGSASFEIIRDLVEKLPIMVAPKWLKTKCQPIAIRGKDVQTALGILEYNPRYASSLIKKLLESAIANAENNNGMNTENLYIAECYANKGPTMKRVKPRAQGRAYRIEKRMSHITIVLDEKK